MSFRGKEKRKPVKGIKRRTQRLPMLGEGEVAKGWTEGGKVGEDTSRAPRSSSGACDGSPPVKPQEIALMVSTRLWTLGLLYLLTGTGR